MSVRRWMGRLGEIRDAVRALPAHIAAHDSRAGASIRDAVDASEQDVRRIAREEAKRLALRALGRVDPVGEQLERVPNRTVADPEHNGEVDVALCPCQACRLICEFANRDDLVSKTHESSFHVADPEVAPSGDPATIMAGTPDTDPSQGDGASVEGPAPRSGPSTSSKRPVNDYIAHRVKWILFIRQIRNREFAAAIGVSPTAVSRLLSGERRWRAETIRSTARFLDMSADDLFPPRDWGRS